MLRRTAPMMALRGGRGGCAFGAPTATLLNRMTKKTMSIDPHSSDGNVGNSFEKIVDDIGTSMPFKVSDDLYDRPGLTREATEHPEAYHSPTSGIDAANAQLLGKEQDTSRMPRDRYCFEKAYDPEVLRKSTASAEHYYPAPPTKEEIQRRRKMRQTWMVAMGTLFGLLVVLDFTLPKIRNATNMVGRH